MTNSEMNEVSNRIATLIAEDNSRIMQSFLQSLNRIHASIDRLKSELKSDLAKIAADGRSYDKRITSLENDMKEVKKKLGLQ